jgi:hypothetical protein
VTDPYPSNVRTAPSDESLGSLISQITNDVSTLMRQEFALAKAELKEEAVKAGKGAGLLGGAGFLGYLVAIFASLTFMYVLDTFLALWLSALIVTLVYAAAAAVLALKGKQQLQKVDPTPHQTVETVKEIKETVR